MARYNNRLAKINRSYTVSEIAFLYQIHPQTVKNWIKQGLNVAVKTKPMLILGADLREFLQKKATRNKKTCQPGEIYCVACKEPKRPRDDYALLVRLNEKVGDLIGECPTCNHEIHRKVSISQISDWEDNLSISEMTD